MNVIINIFGGHITLLYTLHNNQIIPLLKFFKKMSQNNITTKK